MTELAWVLLGGFLVVAAANWYSRVTDDQKLFQQGWQVAGTSSEGLANRIKADTALLGGVIAMRNIKAQ